jgi:hypothetical protein
LVFYWNCILFLNDYVLPDRLGIEICLWDSRTGILLGRRKTDIVVQGDVAGWVVFWNRMIGGKDILNVEG